MKKYETTSNTKIFFEHELYQIKALKDFGNVKAGDLGGYIEKEGNLSQEGKAWISGNAQVYGDAQVCSDAQIYGDAQISSDTDYICFKGFGSENRNTTMFRTKNGDVMVKCGCFMGNLKEFERKVKKTHGNTKYAKEYLVCVEAAKIHFEIED